MKQQSDFNAKIDKLLKRIIERFGCTNNGTATFMEDETRYWVDGAIDFFVKNGLLQEIENAEVIECSGCEEACFMEVNIIQSEDKKRCRAFISCDKRDDVGRINVDFCELRQWQLNTGLLTDTISKLLNSNNNN